MTKCQITCKSLQKSSKCQIFQWVWHLVIFRADQLKKPPCTMRKLKNFGFIDKSHFCFFQLYLMSSPLSLAEMASRRGLQILQFNPKNDWTVFLIGSSPYVNQRFLLLPKTLGFWPNHSQICTNISTFVNFGVIIGFTRQFITIFTPLSVPCQVDPAPPPA